MPVYQNLPRVELRTIDNQLIIHNPGPVTESVLIIGPALDGPSNTPVRLFSNQSVEAVFGPVTFDSTYKGPNGETTGYSGNALVKAVREAQRGGVTDIRLMRVGGVAASGTFSNSGPPTGTIIFVGIYPGRVYNGVTVTFTSGSASGQVVITQPAVKGGDLTIRWSGETSGLTVDQVINRINSHPRNTTVRAYRGTISGSAAARQLHGSTTLAGGTDGTVKDDYASNKYGLYTKFVESGGVFDTIMDYNVDLICLAGIYLDDKVVSNDSTKSIAVDFANFLAKRSVDYPILGVIGIRPLDDFSDASKIRAHYDALVSLDAGDRATNWTKAGYFMANGFTYNDPDTNQVIDAGAYLQVVAADVIFSDPELGLYTENAAALYAGSLASLPPHKAITHRVVPGVFGLPYSFTRAQLNTLVGGIGADEKRGIPGGGAYVTVRSYEGRGTLWTRDVTAAKRSSDYAELKTLRIANAAHKGISAIAFNFLGVPNDMSHLAALEREIVSFLDTFVESGAVLGPRGVGYQVEVRGGSSDPMNTLLGIVDVHVMLRPAFQIRAVRVHVRVST